MLPLPEGHRFPMDKYRLLRERLMASGRFEPDAFALPAPIDDEALLRVHEAAYLRHLTEGTLPREIERRIGFPWSPEMVERSRRSVGATLAAARSALVDRVGVNLAGGTHHAFAASGGGFCVFNDTVVAAHVLLAEGLAERILVVDLDVHQGDGTAELCRDEPRIFTFSIHGAGNYPARKKVSDLDVALADATGDAAYLAALKNHLAVAVSRHQPDFVFYLAGADPFHEDRYGRLALSKAGLAARDRHVFETVRRLGCPVAVSMAGGYAPQVSDIVDIHEATVLAARDILAGATGPQPVA
ncbi:MAG: histone deacetylase [Xanthomonadales bacterium]|nr:histone deacetylase [Xanthomonadales bacterium]